MWSLMEISLCQRLLFTGQCLPFIPMLMWRPPLQFLGSRLTSKTSCFSMNCAPEIGCPYLLTNSYFWALCMCLVLMQLFPQLNNLGAICGMVDFGVQFSTPFKWWLDWSVFSCQFQVSKWNFFCLKSTVGSSSMLFSRTNLLLFISLSYTEKNW